MATVAQPLGAERNNFTLTRAVTLAGLAPGETYHYRFVAVSDAFTTEGPDRTFTTRVPSAAKLPDGRGYEMVSPPNKNNGEVGGSVLTISPHQTRPDGEEVTYTSLAAFGEDPKSASAGSQYISRRGAGGWVTENISPPNQEGYISAPVRGFSEDLTQAVMAVRQPPLVPGAPEGVENLYLRDNASGQITLITKEAPTFIADYCVNFSGASDDYSRIFFIARGALTDNAPIGDGMNLYEWTAAEGISLVSILKTGVPAVPHPFSGFGAGAQECVLGSKILFNAISDDGSKAIWSVGGSAAALFGRLNGEETVQLDKPQGGAGPAGNGRYWFASSDGAVVYFTATGKLTPGVGENALYRYDFEEPEGQRLSPITPGPGNANVMGVMGASEDGRRLYYVATSVQATGAEAGKPNLYLWEEGTGSRYVVTLVDASEAGTDSAHATPDGSALTFLSRAPLTGFDNTSQKTGQPAAEVFLYDAETEDLACVSCNPTGARPLGEAKLPSWSTPFQQPRYLSDSGDRLFFMTADALDLHDTNASQDVYEFERPGVGDCTTSLPTYSPDAAGCISLISPGNQSVRAVFIDASSEGDDIFFATPQSLVGQDVDANYDIYDARAGGGFPPPPPPADPCTGETCRPPAPPPPAVIPPATSGAAEGGNVKEKPKKKKCKKAKKGKGKKAKSCKGKKGKKASKSGRAER